jgi:hypothetical protein
MGLGLIYPSPSRECYGFKPQTDCRSQSTVGRLARLKKVDSTMVLATRTGSPPSSVTQIREFTATGMAAAGHPLATGQD